MLEVQRVNMRTPEFSKRDFIYRNSEGATVSLQNERP